jgi:hypothetical protein
MKRFQTYIVAAIAFASIAALSSCYREPNPLDSLASIGGPVAIVRNSGFINSTRIPGNDIVTTLPETRASGQPANYNPLVAPGAGEAVDYTVEFTTLEADVNKIVFYAAVGTAARAEFTNITVNDARPSPNRYRRTVKYTVPAGTASRTVITLSAGVFTANGESLSPTARITVR